MRFSAEGANAVAKVATNGGNITITGTSNASNVSGDISTGIQFRTYKADNLNASNPSISIVSRTGNVTLTGDNTTAANTRGIYIDGANFGKVTSATTAPTPTAAIPRSAARTSRMPTWLTVT